MLVLSAQERSSSFFYGQALSRAIHVEPPKAIYICACVACAAGRLKLSCLVQNQTAFSASHVQADWAHLDHVVYKNEVSEHKL